MFLSCYRAICCCRSIEHRTLPPFRPLSTKTAQEMQERARPKTSYPKDEARRRANLRRSCPKAAQPAALLVQWLRQSCIDVRRFERRRAHYRDIGCAANTVMTCADLLSLIISFLPQSLHTVALVGPVSKTWRDEVTTAPRTIANLITAPFTIARSLRGRLNDSLRRGPRSGGSAALVRQARRPASSTTLLASCH